MARGLTSPERRDVICRPAMPNPAAEDAPMTDKPAPYFAQRPRIATSLTPEQMRPAPAKPGKKGGRKRKGAVSLAGCEGKFEAGVRIVDDPYEAGAKLKARVNLREHPLEMMRARDRITEAHYRAGARFRAIYERARIGAARGIDFARVRVDGGGAGDPLDAGVAEAHRELGRLYGWLGEAGARIVEKVCGEGLAVADLAVVWPHGGNRLMVQNYLTMRLSEALEVLASQVWGATGRGRAAMRAEPAEQGAAEGVDMERLAERQAERRAERQALRDASRRVDAVIAAARAKKGVDD